MLNLTLCLLCFADPVPVVMKYQAIPEDSEDFLQLPFSIAFSSSDELYVLDALGKRVHVWGKDARYLRSFGKSGMGPGEMSRPERIDILNDRLWLYDHTSRRLSQFSLAGDPLKTISAQVRAYKFVALRDDRFLVGYKKHSDEARTKASFELLDENGRVLRVLKEYDHGGYLQNKEGKTRIKAFGPEIVIHRTAANRCLFGFSQENLLYEVNDAGEIIASHRLEMFTEKPNDLDKEHLSTLSFPNSSGSRSSFETWKHLELSFEYDKAYYTHFTTASNNGLLFVLTPLGGFGSAAGYHQATYFVSDLESKKIRSRGHYAFPEDSIVLMESGRVILFEVKDDGSYAIQQIQVPGT